jgi:hypothetical protein
MAKEKKAKTSEKAEPIWDQIVESVTEENKKDVVEELEKVIGFLENGGDQDLLIKFKATLKKIK